MDQRTVFRWGIVIVCASITFCEARGQDLRIPQELSTNGIPCKANLDAAIVAFKAGEDTVALEQVNLGLTLCPGNATLVELRGLLLFARGDYREASVAIHRIMGAGPGWNWTTVNALYPNVETYTKHLRALEAHAKKHPDDGPARFLQAYHYLVIGAPKAAARELEMVIRLEINDPIAADLLKKIR